MANKKQSDTPDQESNQESSKIELQLKQAQEAVLRAQADYQNLIRRTREDKSQLIKIANMELIQALLEPIDHLDLAAKQINNDGLDMIVYQFKKTLAEFGVEEIATPDQFFDVNQMEVVENLAPDKSEDQLKVVEVMKTGYKLNGMVIRHAKVVVG